MLGGGSAALCEEFTEKIMARVSSKHHILIRQMTSVDRNTVSLV